MLAFAILKFAHPLVVLGLSCALIAAYFATIAIGMTMSNRAREREQAKAWLEYVASRRSALREGGMTINEVRAEKAAAGASR